MKKLRLRPGGWRRVSVSRELGLLDAAARCIAIPRSRLPTRNGALRHDMTMQTEVGVDRDVPVASTPFLFEHCAQGASMARSEPQTTGADSTASTAASARTCSASLVLRATLSWGRGLSLAKYQAWFKLRHHCQMFVPHSYDLATRPMFASDASSVGGIQNGQQFEFPGSGNLDRGNKAAKHQPLNFYQ